MWIEDSVSGKERIVEYASNATDPAAGMVKKKLSGQKYCCKSKVACISARDVSHVGIMCSNRARWRDGTCFEIFSKSGARGSTLYRRNCGGSKPMASRGPVSRASTVGRSVTGDCSLLITS